MLLANFTMLYQAALLCLGFLGRGLYVCGLIYVN